MIHSPNPLYTLENIQSLRDLPEKKQRVAYQIAIDGGDLVGVDFEEFIAVLAWNMYWPDGMRCWLVGDHVYMPYTFN